MGVQHPWRDVLFHDIAPHRGKAQLFPEALLPVIAAPQTADGAISWIGGQAVGLIQQFMSDASNFEPKGKIQRERYPSYADSPLMVTGRLRNSITWEVEE